MVFTDKKLAQYVIQLCKHKEIKHVVISPGSRNAPLTIGFTNQSYFKCYSIVDERSAGFFALGIAQQLLEPVVVVCTSGSALLNYYPAVAEAYYSGLPLIVISADRPKHLVNIGDGQTIFQKHAFGKHIIFEANLGKFSNQKSIKLINKALNISKNQYGPVHINIPFDEPLYGLTKNIFKIDLPKNSHDKYINPRIGFLKMQIWKNAKRKLVLVGVNHPDSIDNSIIEKLANDPSVIVLTETTSNLHHPNFFPFIDQLIIPLLDSQYDSLKPDILLTFGGLIISKKIKAFLREFKPKHHWHVDTHKANDTFFSLNKHFKCRPNQFLKILYDNYSFCNSNYFNFWNFIKLQRLKDHKDYIKSIPFCDFKAFELISSSIPNNYMVQSSNSSVIRYLQLFEFNKSIKLFCNRGTSGIDGSTSTAVGASNISKDPTLLISGDLSFFYDSNGLWNNYIPKNFKIIVINNDGGGIFRILPGNDNSDIFKTFFETKHGRSAKLISIDNGFNYNSSNSSSTLKEKLSQFFTESDKPQVLEIFTPSEINDKILLEYFEYLKNNSAN